MSALTLLTMNPANGECADCKSSNIQWASINNGIFLCVPCGLKHKELGPALSFAKDLKGKGWSENRIKYLRIGGNERFLSVVSAYYLDRLSLEKKYNSPVLHWYRAVLKAEIEETRIPEAPPIPEEPSVISSISENLEKIADTNESMDGLIDDIKEKAHDAEDFAVKGIQKTADTVVSLKNSVVNQSVTIGTNVASIGEDFYDKSMELGSDIYDKSMELGTGILDRSVELGSGIFDKSLELGTGIFGKSKEIGTGIFGKSKEIGTGIFGKSKEIGTGIFGKSKEIGSNVLEKSFEVGGSIVEASSNISQEIFQSEPLNFLQEKTSGLFSIAKTQILSFTNHDKTEEPEN